MTDYIFGVKSDYSTLHVVVLKDGNYHSKKLITVPPDSNRSAWDRNHHLFTLAEGLLEYASDFGDNISIVVETSMDGRNRRNTVELAQTVGMVLSMPFRAHEVSRKLWKSVIVGRGGVTNEDVRDAVSTRFNLDKDFGADQNWFDAFCLARFGYLKDEQDS